MIAWIITRLPWDFVRRQQFLLWNIDCSDCDTVAEVRETSRMKVYRIIVDIFRKAGSC